jgi:outer membrane protein OmpA-like peptidoglycan-associated protein
MEVKFATGSARLTAEAREQLESLGKVLAARNGTLNPAEIVVEGHTDPRGSADSNKALSARRAESVVNYLVDAFRVDPKALKPVGRGAEYLKDAANPDAAVNRRVELVRSAD